MVKIETKKLTNLPELIKWAWKHKKTDITCFSCNDSYVRFDEYGDVAFVCDVRKNDLFQIEFEEEITEETEIPLLLEVYSDFDDGNVDSHISKNSSIADCYDSHSVAFHRINPDGTLTLLWTKEGGMVE